MPIPEANSTSGLAQLFARGADGFSPQLLNALPRPWDAMPPGQKFTPAPYLVDSALGAAAWVALLLRQPLMLTGDPGVGKTRFAEKLSGDLNLGPPTTVQVKSATAGRDLLYTFDDLMRFRDATIAGSINRQAAGGNPPSVQRPLIAYVKLQGLGRAILRAAGGNTVIDLVPTVDRLEAFGPTLSKKETLTLADVFPQEFGSDRSPRHSVVLIDELDKAPRDTPNDLLTEVERMTFRFDELGFGISADPAFKPIVIITSNAERNLPDAFLRRCVFHHIATPDREAMCRIAAARLGGHLDPSGPLLSSAWSLFEKVASGITEKKPGTAEFIALVAYLRAAGLGDNDAITDDNPLAESALRVFTKTKIDLATAGALRGASAGKP